MPRTRTQPVAARRAIPTGTCTRARRSAGLTPRQGANGWRRGVVVTALSGVGIVALITISISPSASTSSAFAAQSLLSPYPVALAREQAPSRSGGRADLPIEQLARDRTRQIAADSQQIRDDQELAALQNRQTRLEDAAEDVQAEGERLLNLATFQWPTAGSVSSGFGWRVHPILRTRRLHIGADIGGACGQPIVAAQSGTVTKAATGGFNGGAGHNVRINHGNINGTNVQTGYLHMDAITVKIGQKVQKGDPIGTVGNTGLSTSCHLHLSLYKDGRGSDPLEYVKQA